MKIQVQLVRTDGNSFLLNLAARRLHSGEQSGQTHSHLVRSCLACDARKGPR